MSAVAEVQTPAPRVHTPPPEPPEFARVALIGKLTHTAKVYSTANGEVITAVMLQQHVPGRAAVLPLYARFTEPHDTTPTAAYQRAHDRAALLLAGGWAMVLGRGVELSDREGRRCLVLLDCYALDACTHPIDPPETH